MISAWPSPPVSKKVRKRSTAAKRRSVGWNVSRGHGKYFFHSTSQMSRLGRSRGHDKDEDEDEDDDGI